MIGTSGARAQVKVLQARRYDLAEHPARRQAWLEDNSGILRRYSAVSEEIRQRINARVAAYGVQPPLRLEEMLGAPTAATETAKRSWTASAALYAEACMAVGRLGDVGDTAEIGAPARWRQAAAEHTADSSRPVPTHVRVMRRTQ